MEHEHNTARVKFGPIRIEVHYHVDQSSESGELKTLMVQLAKQLNDLGVTMSAASDRIDAAIADLTTKVDAQTTVDQSAMTLLTGLTATVAQAIADAKAAGATDAQIASFVALRDTMGQNNTDLAASVAANTPAAPAP